MFHNSNLLIFATKIIIHINILLCCVVKYIIHDGLIDSWN